MAHNNENAVEMETKFSIVIDNNSTPEVFEYVHEAVKDKRFISRLETEL